MSVLVATLQGRMGNQAMQWLFCYGYAMRHTIEFQCDPWIGERIFDLPPYRRPENKMRPRWNENELVCSRECDWTAAGGDVEFRGYAQMQKCVDQFTKREAQRWFKLGPELATKCARLRPETDTIIGHRRDGDYSGYGGYPVVKALSYYRALKKFGFDEKRFVLLSEESPTYHDGLPDDVSFLADFYRMMMAPVLLRGNSSFSWLASLLGNGITLAPVIDNCPSGACDPEFVCGNHPRFTNHLDFITDLHVAP